MAFSQDGDRRRRCSTTFAAAVTVLALCNATSFVWTFSPLTSAQLHRRNVQRRFIGDLFGDSKEGSPADEFDEVFDDEEPGRGGPYAPAGFDTKRMQFDIVRYPHPSLRQENEDIKTFDRRLRRLADNLFATLYATGDGIGLAAPQVGINLRVMVYNPNPRTRDEETVFVNPRIMNYGKEQDYKAEGCLSFPRIKGPVQRPTWVEVEAVDWDGNPFQRRIDGFEARLFLHEYDHLDGIVFTDRLGEASKKKVEPDLEFFIKDFQSTFPELEPAL